MYIQQEFSFLDNIVFPSLAPCALKQMFDTFIYLGLGTQD